MYPFHHLLPSAAMSPPAVTALPADFRPLSLAAGHCGYCPLSFPPSPLFHLSQCPGRCTCIFTCTAATTHTPHGPLSRLACYQIPVLRLLLFRVPGHLLCAVCAGMCLPSALCSFLPYLPHNPLPPTFNSSSTLQPCILFGTLTLPLTFL